MTFCPVRDLQEQGLYRHTCIQLLLSCFVFLIGWYGIQIQKPYNFFSDRYVYIVFNTLSIPNTILPAKYVSSLRSKIVEYEPLGAKQVLDVV